MYNDQKGPYINAHNKEFLDNHSSYTILLRDIALSMMSDYVSQLW